jgi:hypothetical protein
MVWLPSEYANFLAAKLSRFIGLKKRLAEKDK